MNVGLDEDLDNVRRLLLAIVKDDPAFMAEPAPRVVVAARNDDNVAMEPQAWLDDERRHVKKRFELRERVYGILTQAGVEMPVDTLQLQPMKIQVQEVYARAGMRDIGAGQ